MNSKHPILEKINLLSTIITVSLFIMIVTCTELLAKDSIQNSNWTMIVIDAENLITRMNNSDVIVVDARPEKEYQQGHIDNAINIPVKKTYSETTPKDRVGSVEQIQRIFGQAGISNNTHVVIYDDGTFINAARLMWVFEVYGHTRVSVLNIGLPGWIAAGYKTSTSNTSLAAKQFLAVVKTSRLSTKFSTMLALNNNEKIIIDARSEDEYLGKTSKSHRHGHIPNSISLPWTVNIDKESNQLKSIAELKKIYAHVNKDKNVITYCNKGRQSSLTYLALRRLGYSVSHYDGSWYEWGNDASLPITVIEDKK